MTKLFPVQQLKIYSLIGSREPFWPAAPEKQSYTSLPGIKNNQ
jgi:hypothetical protein